MRPLPIFKYEVMKVPIYRYYQSHTWSIIIISDINKKKHGLNWFLQYLKTDDWFHAWVRLKELLPDNNTVDFQGIFLHFHCTSWLRFSIYIYGCNLSMIILFQNLDLGAKNEYTIFSGILLSIWWRILKIPINMWKYLLIGI